MGLVISNLIRPFKNYNALSRAHKFLDEKHVRPAPRYPSSSNVTGLKQNKMENSECHQVSGTVDSLNRPQLLLMS